MIEQLIEQYGKEYILDLLASGASNWEIARALKIKPYDIRYLRENWELIYIYKHLRLVYYREDLAA